MELLHLCLLFLLLPLTSTATNSDTDLSSLLSFKSHVADPSGILASNWTVNTSFCSWFGVSCSRQRPRVTRLELPALSLHGIISPHIGNLSFLSHLNLSTNALAGPIPDSLGQLRRLVILDLDWNHLSGPIPPGLFNMSSLLRMYIVSNNLSGPLPMNRLSVSPPLQLLSLSQNQLTGVIPSAISDYSMLRRLSLSSNMLSGSIPPEVGRMTWLDLLYLGGNRLGGSVPASIGNLSSLSELDLSYNNLEGPIPGDFGNMSNLQFLNLGYNGLLTGSIPVPLLNASMLNILELAGNSLTGSIPSTLGMFTPLLYGLSLAQNRLTGGLDFIASLSNCRNLVYLEFSINVLEGILPTSVGNLSSQLTNFHAMENRIEGSIPKEFGNLTSLILLDVSYNKISGRVPSELARLVNLQALHLGGNELTGAIPFEIGRMTRLIQVYFHENALSGPIPSSIGNISGLLHLSLASNKLSSNIPNSLWSLKGLVELNLSRNSLEGSLPREVGNLEALDSLDLSKNRLSGNLSNELEELKMLTYLDLSSNSFHGQIPRTIGRLINLKNLNLSYNLLIDSIPDSLANLRYLSSLDLSFNNLTGKIPEGRVFSNISIPTLVGNLALCGAPQLSFPLCSANVVRSNSRRTLHFLKYLLPVLGSVAISATVCLMLILRRRSKTEKPDMNGTSHRNEYRAISYHELVRGTDNFSGANLLGNGVFGSVFKVRFDDGLVAAVKVLNLEAQGASRSFDVECNALGMVRHRNLVKIISTCANLDFKALVLEYKVNGSLDKWLHSDSCYLNLLQRISIMVDVSLAMEYLHHHHPHVIVHRDLKPSNVLLDEDMVAYVGDFGIAKLLLGDSRSVVSASAPGTIGYMAPEYGSAGKISRKSDVYSFGILLLETFTGKRPTDGMFEGELSLRRWVSEAIPANSLEEIADCSLLSGDDTVLVHRTLSSLLELGLLCSNDLLKERIPMIDVVPRLQKIKYEYSSALSGR